MNIYISGPVTGHDDYYEKFHKAELLIQSLGHSPINPAAVNAMLPKKTTWKEYMNMSFVMLDMADAIYLMDGWQDSKGANQEYGYARARNLAIIDDERILKEMGSANISISENDTEDNETSNVLLWFRVGMKASLTSDEYDDILKAYHEEHDRRKLEHLIKTKLIERGKLSGETYIPAQSDSNIPDSFYDNPIEEIVTIF